MACATPTIVVGGISIPTNEFANSRELQNTVSGDQGDPTFDGYDENIANGNNTDNKTGVQVPGEGQTTATQTTPPTPSPIPPAKSNTAPPPGGNGVPVTCPIWDGVNYDIQLSPNFTLRNFTIGYPSGIGKVIWPHPLTAAPVFGYTMQQRFCNLMALSVNIAEPIRAKFGAFTVTSGLRNITSASSGLSQHVKGEAIDIQFPGWTYNRYWENAQWIKDNIKYDQFIYEHSDKTGLAWYHISFNQSGNRSASLPTKVMTMYRNHYDPGLKRYG